MQRIRYGWAFLALGAVACSGDDPISNDPPVAVIEAEAAAESGVPVELDGSGSHDPDEDDLSYAWSFTARPSGSSATISDAGEEIASFVPDVTGTYTVQLVVSDGDDSDSETMAITVDARTLGSIFSDSVIPNTNAPAGEADYRIADNASVTFGGQVTVAPGVTIRVGQDAVLHVPTGGALHAVGTAALPIRFVGAVDAPGYWSGIEIDSDSDLNELTYVEVANAGAFNYAGLYLDGTAVVTHSTFRESQTYGIHATPSAALPGFAQNTFGDNNIAAMRIPAQLIGSIDAATDFGEGAGARDVSVSGGTVSGAQTWRAISGGGVPTAFVFDANANVAILGAVSVEPGAYFVMGGGSVIHVPSGGSFSAVGTATDSIFFLGSEAVTGHWSGFEIDSHNAANRMSYVVVAHAGAFNYAGLYLDGIARVDHSHFRDSQTQGLFASSSATLPGFAANRFSGNVEGPVELSAELMGSLDAASDYSGNDIDYITVFGGLVYTTQTWPATNVPFLLAPNAQATITTAVSVAPGFVMHAGQYSVIHVPTGGSISAVGTAADSIVFRGAVETPGYWRGLEIDSDAGNTMSYVRVGHGGAFNYANIWLDGTLTLSNSHIHDSSTYGVDYDDLATFNASGVTYANNAQGNTHVH